MNDSMIHLSFSMKDIFTLIPDIAKALIRSLPAASATADAFKDKEIGLSFSFDGLSHSLLIKNGRDFTVGNGDLKKPLLHTSMTMEDLQKLITVENAKIFLGKGVVPSSLGGLARPLRVFETLSSLRGTVVTELKGSGDTLSRITFVFNGVETPQALIRLSMDNLAGIATKKDNPVNLFMSGQLQIEGDMGLAMKVQALF